MTKTIKVALAGAGAFGLKHLDGIKRIDGVEVISLVGRELDKTQEAAEKYGVGHATTELSETLKLPGLDAVILATPTQMHAAQTIQCLEAGKHVQVEIPLADSLEDAEAVAAMQKTTGLVAMVGHTRRFNPSHQFVHKRILAGDFHIQQMDVQTYFFRRTNMNALGQPRSLDRSSALAPRRAHGRPVRLSGPLADREGERGRGADPPDARHRHGHEHPAEVRERRDLHAVAVVQQRRAARHVLPLHRRQRHLHRPLRRPLYRQGRDRSTSPRSTSR